MKYNNAKLNEISPYIFTKKFNNKHKVIPLNLTINTSGPVKHFPPATKEWFNSIYAYNSNNMKNLSIADKTLSSLIKSYFNFYFSNKVIKSKRIATRFRRLDVKTKIFISKAEVKHTSSKVIITLFVYNEEKRNLNANIKELTGKIFPSNYILYYKKNIFKKKSSQYYSAVINDWFYEYKNVTVLNWFTNTISSYLNELMLERESFANIKNKKRKSQPHLKKINLLNRENLLKGMEKWINFSTLVINDFFKNRNIIKDYDWLDDTYFIYLYWLYMGKRYKVIKYYKTLLRLNNAKFKDFFVKRLNPLISSIYKKEVQLNIVNLKTLYFNSDIFTQVIALKLKNRDNRLIRVLRSALYLVKLPKVNLIKERFDNTIIKDLWNNKVNNFKVSLLLNKINLDKSTKHKDTLDVVLSKIFTNASFSNNKTVSINSSISILDNKPSLLDYILTNLKNKNMAGVRLEAKGRLTRRFTASRSVFKLKWKGGIRNIDSSYRGLSAVMLRGHITSNIQYTQKNSKTRIGAFGLKGWVSSK